MLLNGYLHLCLNPENTLLYFRSKALSSLQKFSQSMELYGLVPKYALLDFALIMETWQAEP